MYTLPASGRPEEQIRKELVARKRGDVAWESGRAFSHAFLTTADRAREVGEAAYVDYLWENGLDPTVFRSLVGLENDVVAIAAAHLRAPETGVGSFTSGGTESVFLALKAARDRARAHRPDIARPQIVVPVTIHPCFHKAAHVLGLDVATTPVDPATFEADAGALRAAMGSDTILVAASAPSYAHGVVDPIPEIAQAAADAGVLMHVDACIGGWLLPFWRRLGSDVVDFDFAAEGVTSMSMDFHKYAFCPKGASVVVYRDPELRRHQFFAHSAWPGYTLVNATAQSSRSGGPLAATWAVLHYLGDDGYLAQAEVLRAASARAVEIIDAIPDLEVLGDPEMTLVAFGSDSIDVFRLCDEMAARDWHMYPQLGVGDLRESVHLTVVPRNVALLDEWAADLRRCVDVVREPAEPGPLAALRESIAELDLDTISYEDVEGLLAFAGLTGRDGGGADAANVPEAMADVNAILAALPPAVTDMVLTAFYDHLHRPA